MMVRCDVCGEVQVDIPNYLSAKDRETLEYALDSGILLAYLETSPEVATTYQIAQWRLHEPIFMVQPKLDGNFLMTFKPEVDDHWMPCDLISQIVVALKHHADRWEPLCPGIAVQLPTDAPIDEVIDAVMELLDQRPVEPNA